MLLKWDKMGLKLEIKPEILGIKVFKDAYKADKSKDKEKFFSFLTYLYFLYFPTSEYVQMYNYQDFEIRKYNVLSDMGIEDSNYFGNIKFKLCEDFYMRMSKNDMIEEIQQNKKTIEKLRDFVQDFDLTEGIDIEKRPLTASQLANVIKAINGLVVQTDKAHRELLRNIDEDDLITSNITKSLSPGDRMNLEMDFSEFKE